MSVYGEMSIFIKYMHILTYIHLKIASLQFLKHKHFRIVWCDSLNKLTLNSNFDNACTDGKILVFYMMKDTILIYMVS